MNVIRIMAYINLVNSMQITRVLTINLTRKLTNEQLTIINHLTYSASKLWNISNYEVIQRNITLNQIKQMFIRRTTSGLKILIHSWHRQYVKN